MKKISVFIFITAVPTMSLAAQNPMFGINHEDSFAIYAGQSIRGDGIDSSTMLMLQYSQPATFLRLPVRTNVQVLQNIDYGSDSNLSFTALGISWDASFFDWQGIYVGAGIGPYIRSTTDDRVDSRFVFGEKVFIGANLSDRWRAEIFAMHFSNGDLTPVNLGFNFAGLSLGYSF